MIPNTIISDKTNIREFVWEIIFRTICHWNKRNFKSFCCTYLSRVCLFVSLWNMGSFCPLFTEISRNRHDLGSKEYLLGLENGTIWARKRHQLSSKQARCRLENGTIWARSWHANTQRQGSKISKFGTMNRDFTTSDG